MRPLQIFAFARFFFGAFFGVWRSVPDPSTHCPPAYTPNLAHLPETGYPKSLDTSKPGLAEQMGLPGRLNLKHNCVQFTLTYNVTNHSNNTKSEFERGLTGVSGSFCCVARSA